ncbi:MAG: COX15/CtaA family protein [Burkholderiaceae bacterium]
MNNVPAVDLAPALELLALASVIAALPLAIWAWRHRGEGARARLVALAVLTLFLTGDLIVFGSFTRLTDSGLGCPDWPGCYGAASPIGADSPIATAQQAQPSGPVTLTKAWIEMVHRYLAMTVGALILVQALLAWRARRSLAASALWAWAALAWVIVQGLFGKYTVTLRLYPAIVTAHLLGGMVLVALLVAHLEAWRRAPLPAAPRGAGWALALLGLQIALGGWVSTNYAVLACRGFPQCNGQWWPAMDPAQGFTLLRELGRGAGEQFLPFAALVAIHMVHRLMALVVTLALAALVWRLARSADAGVRRYAAWLGALLALQLASGLSNVLLDWPLAAALVHSGCAAGMVGVLVSLWCRSRARQLYRSPGEALAHRPSTT